ncbi:voltage-dependent calcium channel subunit alpha-2/delta-1-like isoform X2 [Littorina saxatilis]|uniref:voltage-dependent calcium channel subunit alpha-2/delta-1-like isoform X2 n=1 Tax=Littorina saxatilis TaxID=31220 RepID=UPI0038B59CCD
MMRTKPRLSRCTNMAAWERSRIALVACVLCSLLGQAAPVDFPNSSRVQTWTENLGYKLRKLLDTLNGYHTPLDSSYKTASQKFDFEFKPVEPQMLVKRMAENLSTMLSEKMDSLWKLVEAAEAAALNYTYNSNLKKGEVSYCNAKDMLQANISLQDNGHFKQAVNFNFSCVHIPVEIYDGDIDILNGLQWTAALDEQFKKNFQRDPQMLWQFFGCQTGFMRTYPASKWNTHGDVDLFDVRRQSWYTQGSSSPKDMMILIDTSGSTHGQALQLMKNAVKSILDTLGENDFVNIVQFAQEAKYVSTCFNHTPFVQANYRNKKQLERDVDSLKALGQADYEKGLRFAFEKFKEFTENQTHNDLNVGANCNKVIILLTDGGTDNAEEVFKEYNWPNKSVRVFTYAVGPTATPVAAIRWMACANRGYFSQIPAMGAIRARVQEYIPVLSRPQVLKNAKAFEWCNIYKDHSGLGMMTTVTLPVYNKTLGSSNQTILGVMGIDVPTLELSKRTPYVQIGPAGYSFAINPNGYAVFHPNLKNTGRYMKDPPNIDLMELELQHDEGELLTLRNRMIEGGESLIELNNTLFLSPDKKYVSLQSAQYAFTNISNTTFRLGLTVPNFRQYYPHFKRVSSRPDISDQHSLGGSAFLIAPWEYLGTLLEDSKSNVKLNSKLASLVEVLSTLNSTSYEAMTEDQKQLLHHLAMDVQIGIEASKYFNVIKNTHINSSANDNSTENYTIDCDSSANANSAENHTIDCESMHGFILSNLLVHFVAMNGGLTVVYPASAESQFEKDLDITNSTYYKRSMLTDGYIITADQVGYNETHGAVTASRSVSIANASYKHPVAVTGVKLDAGAVQKYVLGILNQTIIGGKHTNTLTCDDDDLVVCYLLDDGGFIVLTNQDNQTFQPGKFLGEVDPEMWGVLVTEEVYSRAVEYDFQATCKVPKDTVSAGYRSFLVPSVDVMFEALTTSWWTSRVAWAFTSFNIYNWLFGSADMYAEGADCCPSPAYKDGLGTVDVEDDVQKEDEDCVKAVQQFYLRPGWTPPPEVMNITACVDRQTSRRMSIGAVNYTNLVLILADLPCDTRTGRVCPEPSKISEEEEQTLVCELSRHPRKRVLSYGCYDNDPNEDDSKCDAATMPLPRSLSFTAACVALITVWLLTGEHR